MIDERYKAYYPETSRSVESGTCEIMYKPWNHFDILSIWAKGDHPLKNVFLGYGFIKDFRGKGDHPLFLIGGSVSTDVTRDCPKDGIKMTVLSYDEAVKRAKAIDWRKVKIDKIDR